MPLTAFGLGVLKLGYVNNGRTKQGKTLKETEIET